MAGFFEALIVVSTCFRMICPPSAKTLYEAHGFCPVWKGPRWRADRTKNYDMKSSFFMQKITVNIGTLALLCLQLLSLTIQQAKKHF